MRFAFYVVAVVAVLCWAPASHGACKGDGDGDGMISLQDFLAFVEVFGLTNTDKNYNAVFDFDGDGLVNLKDYLAFVEVFGQSCQSASTDREILTVFYHATGGDKWKDNTNWLSDKPLSEWYGIGTKDGRVDSLSLRDRTFVCTSTPVFTE